MAVLRRQLFCVPLNQQEKQAKMTQYIWPLMLSLSSIVTNVLIYRDLLLVSNTFLPCHAFFRQ